MQRVMGLHTVTKAKNDARCTVVEKDSNATDFKMQTKLNPVAEMPSDTRSKIERALAIIGEMTKKTLRRQLKIV